MPTVKPPLTSNVTQFFSALRHVLPLNACILVNFHFDFPRQPILSDHS